MCTLFSQGLADKMDFHRPIPESECRSDGSPPKPDELVLDVCMNAMVYTAYLALHYFRKNADGKGKLVFTASMAGLYPGLGIPLYSAAKHGVSSRKLYPFLTHLCGLLPSFL